MAALVSVTVAAGALAAVTGGSGTPAGAAGARPDFSAPVPCGVEYRADTWAHPPALDITLVPIERTEGSPLVAAAAGRVITAEYRPDSGNVVRIDHGGGWVTTYLHLQSLGVTTGTPVVKGTRIGSIGRTGTLSNNRPHVHFEEGFDGNHDGIVTWGDVGTERVPAVLDGVAAPTGPNETAYGTSGNCGTAPAGRSGGRSYEYQNQQHVLGWSTTNKLTSYWYQPGGSGGWETPGFLSQTEIAGQPVGISALGQQHVFVRSPVGHLLHWWYQPDGQGWRPGDLGGSLRGTPATCTYQTGAGEQVHAFGSTAGGRLGHWWYEPGGAGWHYGELAGGSAASGPTCVAWRNQLHVFARSTSGPTAGSLWHWWYVPGVGWKNEDLGGALTNDPAATTYAPPGADQIAVFGRSPAGTLVEWWYDGGWKAPRDLGGELAGTPTAGTVRDTSPPQLQVFGRTPASKLHHWWYVPGQPWRDQDDGDGVGGNPTLLIYTYPAPDQQQVFAKSTAGTRLTNYRYLPGTGWVQSNLGGSVAL